MSNAPTTSVAPEWDLLLIASSADPDGSALGRIRRLLEEPVDWEMVLRLADNHGTSSLLYQNLLRLADMVPASTLASLRQRYEGNIYKSLFLTRELMRIVDWLGGLGIDAVPYKGVVMSEVYYGDMALRQSGDMDLFVRKRDVGRIKSALAELEYTTRLVIPDEVLEDYLAAGYEWTFDSPAGPNLLELQWALQPRFYAVDFDMDGLFERAVKVTMAGRSVKTPSPEDLLLVLSVHAAKHVWARLIWLCDIAQILKREILDWDRVQVRTRELGIERILRVTLLLANRFLGTAIPAAIESAVLADQAARGLAGEIAAALAAGVSYDTGRTSYFRLMMRLRERRADRARFLARLAFTPGPGEWEAVRLPGALSSLYRVVRVVRLAGRFARG
ncbi:MAG: nucleotidyltransferase family protein [Candidatus Sulfotelmatobacter sp.]